MQTTFQVNLIKGEALPAPKRQALFWGMLGYLAICGLVLVVVANTAARRAVRAARLQREIASIESRFRSESGKQVGVLDYADTQRREMERCTQRLAVIESVLGRRLSLTTILYRLAVALPPGVELLAFEVEDDKPDLIFDIMVPEQDAAPLVDAGRLVAEWNRDEELRGVVHRIRSAETERRRIRSESVYVFKFRCEVERGRI